MTAEAMKPNRERQRSRGAAATSKAAAISWTHFAAWFAMLLVAILNGALRDLLYGQYMSELAAHQLSSAVGCVLEGVVMAMFLRRFPPASGTRAIGIGLLWTTLTVAFEFGFFHYAGGRSWAELVANYDLRAGRVWVLVLLWIAAAPYFFFRLRARHS